jgi:hypothetical protein
MEYHRILEKEKGWSDEDVKFLLAYIQDLQESQLEIADQLRTALKELDTAKERLEFYRIATMNVIS